MSDSLRRSVATAFVLIWLTACVAALTSKLLTQLS